jgi:hypothetical protein
MGCNWISVGWLVVVNLVWVDDFCGFCVIFVVNWVKFDEKLKV